MDDVFSWKQYVMASGSIKKFMLNLNLGAQIYK